MQALGIFPAPLLGALIPVRGLNSAVIKVAVLSDLRMRGLRGLATRYLRGPLVVISVLLYYLMDEEGYWLLGLVIGGTVGAFLSLTVSMVWVLELSTLLVAGVLIVAMVAFFREIIFTDDETGAWAAFVATVLIASVPLMQHFGVSLVT